MSSRRFRRVQAVIACAALVGGVGALTAQPSSAAGPGDIDRFDAWVGYAVGDSPTATAMGDCNKDGSLDVAWGLGTFLLGRSAPP